MADQLGNAGFNTAPLAARGRPDLDGATWVAVVGALVLVVAVGGAISTVVKGILGW